MTDMHFEQLWEECEQFHQQAGEQSSMPELMGQLAMKVDLYKAMDARVELPAEDRQKAKSRLMGEILLTLTHISLQDNINVFEALGVALQYRSVNHFSDKYQTT